MRLVGDMSGYVDTLKKAQAETKQATDHMAEDLKRLAVVGATGMEAKSFLKESLEAFSKAEKNMIGLEAAIKSNGKEVDETVKSYKDWTKEIKENTSLSGGQLLSLAKMGETYRLTTEQNKQATMDAIALGAATGQSAEAMLRFTAAMAKGDTERAMMFTRMIPQLRGIKDEAELTVAYQKLVANGMEVISKETNTLDGQLEIVNREWGAFKKGVGEAVNDALLPFAKEGAKVAKMLGEIPTWAKQATAAVAGLVVAISALTAMKLVNDLLHVKKAILAVSKAAINNPFVWVAAAAAAILLISRHIVAASEAMRKLEGVLADFRKNSEKEAAGRRDSAKSFLEGNSEDPAALRQRIADITKVQDELRKKKTQFEKEFAEATDFKAGTPLDFADSAWKKIKEAHGADLGRVPRERLGDVTKQLEATGEELVTLQTALDALDPSGAVRNIQILKKIALDSGAVAKDLAEGYKKHNQEFTSFVEGMMKSIETPAEKARRELTMLTAALFAGIITLDQYGKALIKIQEEANKGAAAISELNRDVEASAFGSTDAYKKILASLGAAGYGGSGGKIVQPFADLGAAKGVRVMPMDGTGPGANPDAGHRGWSWDRVGEGKNLPPGSGTWSGVGEGKGRGAVDVLEDILGALRAAPVIGVANIGG